MRMTCCLFLESCLFFYGRKILLFWLQRSSQPVCLCISLLSIHLYPPTPFPPISFLFQFPPPPITVKLQGDSLGTFFLTEKIWQRSESPASIPAFLSRFKWFFLNLLFAASQAHPPRQPDLLTLQVSPTLPLSLSLCHSSPCAHRSLLSFRSFFPSVTHIQTCTYKKKKNTIQT